MEKTQEEYENLVKEHFPEIKFSNTRLLKQGWDNNVLILDNSLVFRFPKREEYKERFKKEVKFLDYLQDKTSIPIPNYIYRAKDLSFGGYKIIKGTEMTPEVFKTFNEGQREKLADKLGAFLSVTHQTPVNVANEFGIQEEKGGYWWSRNNAKETFNKIQELVFPKLSQGEVSWIEHQFNTYLSLSFDFELSVIHSDFTDDHIFVDEDKGEVVGIIDFSDIEIADPALDFAGMWYYSSEPSFAEMVVANYQGKVDKDFLHRSKFPRLVHMVGNMLEIAEGGEIPQTFEICHEKLVDAMASGVTL